MKFSEQWLREWVNPAISTQELVEQLTLGGLEVASTEPVAPLFSNVVVGQVREVLPHPNADRLRVCQVDVNADALLQIVCGADNVRTDLKVAVAMIDATLPGDFKIKKSKLRGVESSGMLCSEKELGLAENCNGIMELANEAEVGQNIRDYLKLDDCIIDIEITPNRGDCLSILGVAREVAAYNHIKLSNAARTPSEPTLMQTLPIHIEAIDACPHYVGRIIKGIDNQAKTPVWMQEKLRRSGLRPTSIIVDITNFVLLELGQPLHAFDLDQINTGLTVRYANDNESIQLLDDQILSLSPTDLVIASGTAAVALAGIKGGLNSSITSSTSDIFLESALFNATTISATGRKFNLHTDSSQRFERGVDPLLQRVALDRASELIILFAGGELAHIIELGEKFHDKVTIPLRLEQIKRILGIELSAEQITRFLTDLGMSISPQSQNVWNIIPPSYRHDIKIEIDLIEELARLYGYHLIPAQAFKGTLHFLPSAENSLNTSVLKQKMLERGYDEAITYSFVDPLYEQRLSLQAETLTLINPIAADLAAMRSNLWPGLIKALEYNLHRQQSRVRLFELGLCFENKPSGLDQRLHLGGLATGLLYPEQWGESKRTVDYFDIKNDLESILALTGSLDTFRYERAEHPALHPGKSAAVYSGDIAVGYIGAINPILIQEFDLNQSVYLFDISLHHFMKVPVPTFNALSKFPAIRRDLALIVAKDLPAQKIKEKILASKGELLKNVSIFDVYQGKGMGEDKKSIALSLQFQHASRTLIDTEINEFMQNLINTLHNEFNAILRD